MNSLASAGSTVYWRAGTYTFSSEQDISVAGNASNPVTWTVYPGDAAPTFTGGDKSQYGVMIRLTGSAAYNTLSSFSADCGAWGTNYASLSSTLPAACGYVVSVNSGTTHNAIASCNIEGARQEAYADSGSYFTVNGCAIFHNANDNNPGNPGGWRNTSNGGGGWPGATAYPGSPDHTLIENSQIYENYGEGALLGGNTATFQNNVVHDNFSSEVGCDGVTSGLCTITGNWIYTNQESGFERYRSGSPAPAISIGMGTEGGRNASVFVANNVVYGGYFNYSYFNNTNDSACYSHYVVVGNTFVNPIGSTYQTNVNIDTNSTSCSTQSGNVWMDNISAVYNGNPNVNIPSNQGFVYDHNDWYGGGGGPLAGGSGDLTLDPLFLGPISGTSPLNFNLQRGSPLLNVGSSILIYTTLDYLGNSRMNTDIGAFDP